MEATLIINTGNKKFDKEPALNGIEESYEKIWSENTGRLLNGKMTGDIIATKLKLSVKYPILTAAERDALNTAIGDAFFSVTYIEKNYKMYAGTPTYPVYSAVNGLPCYVGVGVDLIEQ